MQTLAFEPIESGHSSQPPTPILLGTSFTLELQAFPELEWLSTYLSYLHSQQSKCDRLTDAIQAIAQAGAVYRDCWIEPYTKTKKGKDYTYYQLRWLTGERKQSGQPKVKTKHLSHRALAAIQAAIARGVQVAALEKERQQVEAEIERVKNLVQGTGRRLHRVLSQNSTLLEGNLNEQ